MEIWSYQNNAGGRTKTIPVCVSKPTAVLTNVPSGGSHAFTGTSDGTVVTTSLSNHGSSTIQRCQLTTDPGAINNFTVIAGDKRKIGIGQDKQAILFDFIAGKMVNSWKHHVSPIKAFEFSPVSDQLGFTASYDFHLKIFDIRTSHMVMKHKLNRPITCAMFQPDGGTIILADISGFIHKVNLRNTKVELIHGIVNLKLDDMCSAPDNFDYGLIQNIKEVKKENFESTSFGDITGLSDISGLSIDVSMLNSPPPKTILPKYKKNVPSPLAK